MIVWDTDKDTAVVLCDYCGTECDEGEYETIKKDTHICRKCLTMCALMDMVCAEEDNDV